MENLGFYVLIYQITPLPSDFYTFVIKFIAEVLSSIVWGGKGCKLMFFVRTKIKKQDKLDSRKLNFFIILLVEIKRL